jgi:peptidoglycan/xylan/chitin deacetylase (PgdA/CDA1 family)
MSSDLLVLCYHAVSESWPADLSVTPDALDRQLADLSRKGYRGARFGEALSAWQDDRRNGGDRTDGPGDRRGGGRSERVVSVTFDDAYRSVLELAKPILDRYGCKGTIFVATDWPDQERPMRWPGIDCWLGTPHERELSALSWPELGALAKEGWEIGSHTCSHPRLTELGGERLTKELADSKAIVEHEVGMPCESLAYPYGDTDGRVLAATKAAGYKWACTIPRVLESPDPLAWPRAPIYYGDDMKRFKAKVSPTLRGLRSSRLGVTLDRARMGVSASP